MATIYPLELGDIDFDASEMTLRKSFGEKRGGKLLGWLVKTADANILVDLGAPLDVEATAKRHPARNLRVSQGQTMKVQLEKLSLGAEDIDLIVLTHLHWDHIGALDLIRDVPVVVTRAEVDYALNPIKPNMPGYEAHHLGMEPIFCKHLARFRQVDMARMALSPEVGIIPAPGHTPGSIAVIVKTDDGPYAIAGDAVCCFENVENGLDGKFIMPGIYMDQESIWKTMENLLRETGNPFHILPGHDPKVLSQTSYPASK